MGVFLKSLIEIIGGKFEEVAFFGIGGGETGECKKKEKFSQHDLPYKIYTYRWFYYFTILNR